MKLDRCILWVWGQNFKEACFWISAHALRGAIPNLARRGEMTHPNRGAYSIFARYHQAPYNALDFCCRHCLERNRDEDGVLCSYTVCFIFICCKFYVIQASLTVTMSSLLSSVLLRFAFSLNEYFWTGLMREGTVASIVFMPPRLRQALRPDWQAKALCFYLSVRSFVCLSVTKLVNTICKLAQMVHMASAWNGQPLGSGSERSRSH